MVAIKSAEDFLSVLDKSKLLQGEQFVKAQSLARSLPADSADASNLARVLARENIISRWQAGQLLAGRTSLRLGKYKLIQLLGRGGMGSVFLAEHVTMNRRVALKVVPRSIADDRASLERFFGEARAIASLDHPNIVQAYSVDTDQDRYFIVMEFVDGHDLQKIVESEGPMQFERAADYIRQAADGLAHAHARNLVHCDIKPSNLLINNHNVLKILDLGLARLNKADESQAEKAGAPGDALGTVDYMAPEQALGSANFDHRADIYSLGCTLYFLLTGHPPFPDGTLAQRIMKHQTQEPRSIVAERPDTPGLLAEIVQRMMAKEPEKRYQAAKEVATALSPWRPAASQTAIRPVQAVKPVEEEIPVVEEGASWLEALTAGPSRGPVPDPAQNRASAVSVFEKHSATAAAAVNLSGKTVTSQYSNSTIKGSKAGPKRRKPGAKSSLWSSLQARLAWLNTPRRKIAAALTAGTALALAMAAVVLPFALASPKTAPQTVVDQQLLAKGTDSPIAARGGASAGDGVSGADISSTGTHDSTTLVHSTSAAKNVLGDNAQPKPTSATAKPPEKTPEKSPEKPIEKPSAPAVAEHKNETKVESKATEPPPVNKPEPPKMAKKPVSLEGLHGEVDLPEFGPKATETVSLGTIEGDPSATLDMQLLGGETVAKGNPKFAIQADAGAQPPGWSLVAENKDKAATKLARLWREDNELKFRWEEDAKSKGNIVRCCGLLISADGKSHMLALTKPKPVQGIAMDFDHGETRLRLSRDSLPDAAMLRLQVLPLDKSLPKSDFKMIDKRPPPARGKNPKALTEWTPGDTITTKQKLGVLLKKDKTPPVRLSIAFEPNGKYIVVDMAATFEVSEGENRFVLSDLQRASMTAKSLIMMADPANYKNGRKPNVPQSSVQQAKTTVSEIDALAELSSELNHKAKIQFQIYAQLGSDPAQKIVLFQNIAGDEASPPDHKGAKKKGRGADAE
jgi:serine/threonine protein kinase